MQEQIEAIEVKVVDNESGNTYMTRKFRSINAANEWVNTFYASTTTITFKLITY